jgi:hypothetical protein
VVFRAVLGVLLVACGVGMILCQYGLRPQGPPGPFASRTVLVVGSLSAVVSASLLIALVAAFAALPKP